MASSGKKGKKNKGTVISLQSFLSNGETPSGTTQVAKKIRNFDGNESDDGNNSMQLVYQLPTAPRANRMFDDDSIPHKPPFIAYITNLPFDANEDDIYEFFEPQSIVSLRLPREDGEGGRVRGFGYIEFETRDDLIHVLSMPDPTLKMRRIRIELSNESEQQNNRQRGNRRGFEGFGNSGENRDSGNWRRDTPIEESSGGGFRSNYDRPRESRPISDEKEGPGSWRLNSRPVSHDVSPRRDFSDKRNVRNRNFEHNITPSNDNESLQERPKLNLKPRTLPLPIIETKSEPETLLAEADEPTKVSKPGIAPEKIFGSAKPVDTASRELEIEERLAEAKRQEKLKQEEERADINEKLANVQLEKTDKENANSVISWRRANDSSTNSKNDSPNHSPERVGLKHDDRRPDYREKDANRYKNRDGIERSDTSKGKAPQNRDGKQKDDSKIKRDTKIDRPLPKCQPNQSEPVLHSANMYSGLDDEASD